MEVPLYQVDAFAEQVFEGNPAAVCLLEEWIDDAIMQSIAAENNLSETAFVVPGGNGEYEIRWFTPVDEVALCGHATLASAHVLFNETIVASDTLCFHSKSGPLYVKSNGGKLEMDLPAQPPVNCEIPVEIVKAFGVAPLQCLKAEDYIVVFDDEVDVVNLTPDLVFLKELDLRGVMVTAASSTRDFVCRFFAPKLGIDEDPVTGSAFCQLVPYWADITGKQKLDAKQVSPRGGYVDCELKGDRVVLGATAVLYSKGLIYLPSES